MDKIGKIREAVGIIGLAGAEGLELQKQSERIYKVNCCFHNENEASLTFYADTDTFKCYGCGEQGDVINFYSKIKGISNEQAIHELYKVVGNRLSVGISRRGKGKVVKKENELSPKKAQSIYKAFKDFCGEELDAETLNYLTGHKRCLDEETIRKFGIFCIKDYKKLKERLKTKFDVEDLRSARILEKPNDRFAFIKHKVIIPVVEDDKIIALRGRFLDQGRSNPRRRQGYSQSKYKSTTGVSGKLFNVDILREIERGEKIFLCEGEFDTMALCQRGYPAVGVLGLTMWNDDMVKKLSDYRLYICFDNDEEGQAQKEAEKIKGVFDAYADTEAIVKPPPAGFKDVSEYFIHKEWEG